MNNGVVSEQVMTINVKVDETLVGLRETVGDLARVAVLCAAV